MSRIFMELACNNCNKTQEDMYISFGHPDNEFTAIWKCRYCGAENELFVEAYPKREGLNSGDYGPPIIMSQNIEFASFIYRINDFNVRIAEVQDGGGRRTIAVKDIGLSINEALVNCGNYLDDNTKRYELAFVFFGEDDLFAYSLFIMVDFGKYKTGKEIVEDDNYNETSENEIGIQNYRYEKCNINEMDGYHDYWKEQLLDDAEEQGDDMSEKAVQINGESFIFDYNNSAYTIGISYKSDYSKTAKEELKKTVNNLRFLQIRDNENE